MSNEEKLNVFKNTFWKPVQESLDNLIAKSPVDIESWLLSGEDSSAYIQVYKCCTAPAIVPLPYESEMPAEFFNRKLTYECLKVYMTERFKEVSLGIESKETSEEAFACFFARPLGLSVLSQDD